MRTYRVYGEFPDRTRAATEMRVKDVEADFREVIVVRPSKGYAVRGLLRNQTIVTADRNGKLIFGSVWTRSQFAVTPKQFAESYAAR